MRKERTVMNYFKIDVNIPGNGYSFLVCTKFNETEESIIDLVYECGVFEYDDDIDYATAERVEKGDYDYNALEGTLVYLDAE